MATFAAQDRLQPSLLDRLTDNEPATRTESAETRVLGRKQLRDAVLRDLSWLFNAACEEPDPTRTDDSERVALWRELTHARDSVMNYGIPPLSGQTLSADRFAVIEEQVRLAIMRFEPRIDAQSLEVRIQTDLTTGLRPTNLRLTIKGQLWNQPVPLELLLGADVDVDTGQTAIRDMRG